MANPKKGYAHIAVPPLLHQRIRLESVKRKQPMTRMLAEIFDIAEDDD